MSPAAGLGGKREGLGHRDHIGRLERDEIDSPRMTTIRKLAEAVDVDPRELLDDLDD